MLALVVVVPIAITAVWWRYGGGEEFEDLTTHPELPASALERVADLSMPPGNIAVSADGRVFFTFHPEASPPVQVAERWSLARLRKMRFFGLGALNQAIRGLLDELNDEGLTLVVVTHDIAVARRADRILVLVDGRVRKRLAGSEVHEVLALLGGEEDEGREEQEPAGGAGSVHGGGVLDHRKNLKLNITRLACPRWPSLSSRVP